MKILKFLCNQHAFPLAPIFLIWGMLLIESDGPAEAINQESDT